MSRNTSLAIPLPMLGLNTLSPFIEPESGYARELTNYMLLNGRLTTRPAILSKVYNATTTAAGRFPAWFDPSNNTAIMGTAGGGIYDLDTAAFVGALASPSTVTRTTHMTLDLMFGPGGGAYLAVSPYTLIGFTTIAPIVGGLITGGCSHKGRFYMHELAAYNYYPVGAITGAPAAGTGQDLSPYLSGKDPTSPLSYQEPISRMFSVSMSQTNTTENVLVVFGALGTVLVYSGLDPGSPSWNLIGRYQMPRPINPQSFVELDGDIFVATTEYCYWFRDLFSGGAQTAYADSPSRPIENLYAKAGTASYVWTPSYQIGAIYWPAIDAIVLSVADDQSFANGTLVNASNYLVQLVYFRKYKAWSLWVGNSCHAPYIISGTYLMGGSQTSEIVQMNPVLAGADSLNGAANNLITESVWKTMYWPTLNGKSHKVLGVRPFYFNSQDGYFYKIRSIFDYSDYNITSGFAGQGSLPSPTVPGNYFDSSVDALTTGQKQYSPRVGVGGSGGALSFQFSQRLKTATTYVNSTLYGATAYVQEGDDNF